MLLDKKKTMEEKGYYCFNIKKKGRKKPNGKLVKAFNKKLKK